jgi:hypothetical protein
MAPSCVVLTERGPDVEEGFDDAAFLCQERRQYNTRTRRSKRGLFKSNADKENRLPDLSDAETAFPADAFDRERQPPRLQLRERAI